MAGLGTGGTLVGVGRRLRRHNPDVRIYAAEPLPGENVQGLRSLEEGFIPEIFDPSVLDGKLLVSNAESIRALRDLTTREGIFAGVSSGAVVAAAQQVAREMTSGTIVALLADGGWKYLSEDIWTRDLDRDADHIESLNLWWSRRPLRTTEPAPRCARQVTNQPSSRDDMRVPDVDAWQHAADGGAAARVAAETRRDGPAWTPASAALPAPLRDELVAWCRDGLPNEACGLLVGARVAEDGGVPSRFVGLRNAAASPYRYLIDPDEQLRVMLEIDDADEVIWGIVHSHVASPAAPSTTDVGLAAYPDAVYLICSFADESPQRAGLDDPRRGRRRGRPGATLALTVRGRGA